MNTQTNKDDGFHEGSLHVNRSGEYAVISRQNGHFTGLRFGDCEEFTALVSDARRIEQFILAESLAKGNNGRVRRRPDGKLELVSSGDYWTPEEEATLDEIVGEAETDEARDNKYKIAACELTGRSPQACRMKFERLHPERFFDYEGDAYRRGRGGRR